MSEVDLTQAEVNLSVAVAIQKDLIKVKEKLALVSNKLHSAEIFIRNKGLGKEFFGDET